MMTLEEAIKHCKDVALSCTNKECALDHFQLLKWLQEYSNMLEKQGGQNPILDFKAKDWYVSKVDGKIYNAKFMEKPPTNLTRKLKIEKAAMSATGIIEQEEWFIKGAEWADGNPSCVQQGEQKPADKIEPKFKVGDWVVYDHRTYQIVELPQGRLINASLSRNGKTEQVPLPYCEKWSINDAKEGDVLCYKDEISLYKHDIKNCTKQETTFGGFVYHCCYDGKRFITDSLYSLTEQDKIDIHPATKEQRELLFQKMKDAGHEWNAEKKELKKIEQKFWGEEDERMFKSLNKLLNEASCYSCTEGVDKILSWLKSLKGRVQPKQEWSEEDELRLEEVICMIEANGRWVRSDDAVKLVLDWLKSLKDIYTWKPSDEQINALSVAVKHGQTDDPDALKKLLEQLKKLKE